MWKIYKHTSPSGKVYIGQTIQDNPNLRWQNGNGYKTHNTIFYLAIQKYGWENFKHEIIEDFIPSQALANEREIYWISYYDSYKNGYNATPGGNNIGDNIPSQKPVCKIDKISGNVIEIYKSESDAERKTGIKGRNIAAVCLKQGQITAGGFYWCFEDEFASFVLPKDKRRISKKEIYCLELDKVFSSLTEASEYIGINKSGIEAVCNKRGQITAGGLHWCFLENKDQLLIYIDEFTSKVKNNPNKKIVVQIDKVTLKPLSVFDSIAEAGRETGILPQQIGKCASGEYISAGGFFWCYKENWDENWKPLLKEKTNSKKVICIETGEIFNNLHEAERKTGALRSSISMVCNKKLLTAGSYHWCWLNEYISNGYEVPINKQLKSVVCIETKEVFNSISDASIKYNIKIPNIISCCKNKQRTAKKLHWCYEDEYEENYIIPRKRLGVLKKVVCIETKEIFDSIDDAQIAYNIKTGIGRACKHKSFTAGGYHWSYYEEFSETFIPPKKGENRFRRVLCIESKKTFESIKSASEATGIRTQYIGRSCRNQKLTAGGYHWQYID